MRPTRNYRKPAVAGRFYPAEPEKLSASLSEFLEPGGHRPPLQSLTKAIGLVVPHAGYMYSGHVAGAVYARVDLPQRNIVLCPNHTGLGVPLSIMKSGAWETPLGDMPIDEELCEALMRADPYLEDDTHAHRLEHALEVQLPFMQHIGGPSMQFVPITIGTSSFQRLEELGRAIATVVERIERTTLIIASSDMNHYESDAITRVKDRKAIDQVLAMNPRGLYDVVQREKISMCGYGPTVSMLTAAKLLGATKAELVKYATSGDVSLDFEHVVGYAGMMVT
jgi:AmmeMemoRadiSam system protein B